MALKNIPFFQKSYSKAGIGNFMDANRNIDNVAVLLCGIMRKQQQKESWWSLSEPEERHTTAGLEDKEQFGG
ncbi:hypothetical protein AB8086_004355 [Salmonella enterica]